MKGNIFSPEDKEFMEIVQSDLRKYLQKNIFPSRTVLVFPPFNGFRRFLIHKLIEDNFASSDVAAFSIGQDISRRIVICYKGLVCEAASKGLPATVPQTSKPNMIDKEKPCRQRQTPTAAVYRPPAARLADNRKSTENIKPADTKQTRVRRPDQQMYVPRPKRASYGNDLPRSRSRSDSRLSLDSDQSLDMKRNTSVDCEESRIPKPTVLSKDCNDESVLSVTELKVNKPVNSSACDSEKAQPCIEENVINNGNCEIVESNHASTTLIESTRSSLIENEILKSESEEVRIADENESRETVNIGSSKNIESKRKKEGEVQVDSQDNDERLVVNSEVQNQKINCGPNTLSSSPTKESFENGKENVSRKKEPLPNEAMETISISSDSRSEDSSSSFTSSSDSKTSYSSVDSEVENKCTKYENSEKMDIDHFDRKNPTNKSKTRSQHEEEKSRKKVEPSSTKVSEVLVISDTSSSDESMKSAYDESEKSRNIEKSKKQLPPKVQDGKVKSCTKQSKSIDPSDCDWESLYDDSGECLVPSLMEELANSVGKVRVTSADSDYRAYQSIEERTNDGECVIEIYDFPAEFKTTDLFNVFAAYRNKNFQIKWVDDTHALGIFPSPLMADEVLACTLPFVKTRPLRLGLPESRNKARNLVLPPLPSIERPKTCTALARRLVTGALGLRIPTSSQEREKEKQVLKEAREKRRLEAKQREAAWDGTITSGSAI